MSEDDVLTLWCLVDGEDRPFSLKAGRNWNIDNLADSILTRRSDLRAGINDIFLWKVTRPTSIDPDEGFRDRFPCPILDFSNESIVTRLNMRTSSVSAVFPALAEGQLHIVVQVEKFALERALKKKKLSGEIEVSKGLWALWEQTWNRKVEAVPWVSLRNTERDNTSTEDVPEYCWVFSPTNDIASAMDLNPPTVLFRDDYLRVFGELFASSGLGNFTPNLERNPGSTFPNFFSGALVPQETPKNGFILTGNPGIGKSICLRIMLLLRLCARLPTFYQVKASSTIFFSDEGPVEFLSDSYELDSYLRKEPTAWALFDSTPLFKSPPDTFLTKKNFVVQTPSPRSDRIEWRSKLPPITICCLRLWTPAELICAAPFQRRHHDEQTLVEFCKKYGYSARDAYGNASTAGEFEQSLRAYCGDLSYEKAAKIITNVQILHFPDDLRHNIICITPTEVGLKYTFDFVSEHVYHCVLDSLQKSEADAAAKFYRLFLTNGKTKAAAGYMLEPAARNLLSDGGSFDIIRLEDSQAPLYIHWKTPRILSDEVQTRLHITSSGISVGEDRESPLGQPPMFEFQKEGGRLNRFGFYCPNSKNQATFFDYLVYDPKDKHGWVFQVTTSPTHTVKEKGIKQLIDLGVEKVSYVAVTSDDPDDPATIDLPFSEHLNEIVTGKYQLRLR